MNAVDVAIALPIGLLLAVVAIVAVAAVIVAVLFRRP